MTKWNVCTAICTLFKPSSPLTLCFQNTTLQIRRNKFFEISNGRKSYLHNGRALTSSALVTPIYKKGNKSNPVNYRSISLTCIPCKMVEYIVLISHIWKDINANNVLFLHQHESQTEVSCQTGLMEAVRDWVFLHEQQ